ncbi:sensor histidine kinase [Halosegnis longus]|uniref:histidine kinase n=1 Tax=Halosegnis longus TaxID=2216012 RepID=A0AAJ4RA39_9EURY|nr:sensor histidine kinase [Salella cibi]
MLFDDDPIGTPIETALPPSLVGAGDEPTRVELDDGVRWLRPDEMPLEDGSRVILFSDLTEERRANERFAEQNRRLEEFAAVAAHDLRNPLNILEGYIDLAREEEDVSYLAETDEPLERARLVVQDLLALGRNMDIVTEPEPVEFDPLVESVVERVADDETLAHDPVGTVVASPSRLERLLENLVENVRDHGGDRIEIGPRPGGFYVADDGPGIPESDRESVFEYDYSTHREGPGLGLPLVASIAAAHGWEVEVHERDDGGARVEVTGVEMPQTAVTQAN